MNYVSANNEHHVPLNVKPIQSKKDTMFVKSD